MTAPAPTPTPTGVPRRGEAEQAQLDRILFELFERMIPFNRVIGLAVDSVRHGDVRTSFTMRDDLVGHAPTGRLHGGVISAVLDATGGLAVMAGIGERHAAEPPMQVLHRFARLGTIDLRVDYLRQGVGQRFVASAEVTRLGGRVGSTQMRLVNDEGTLIATAAAAYIVS